MKILSFFLPKKSDKSQMKDADILMHSKVTYSILSKFYADLVSISESMNPEDKSMVDGIEKQAFGDMGIKRFSGYSPDLLKNDVFKIFTIYHYYVSKIFGRQLSYSEFNFYKTLMERIVSSGITSTNLSLDSYMMKKLNISPSILPKEYIKDVMAVDEQAKAIDIILAFIKKLDRADDYSSYDLYKEYVQDNIGNLIKTLHDAGLYNTHNEERFVVLCIEYKVGGPMLDSLYRGGENEDKVSTKSIIGVQKTIFKLMGKDVDGIEDLEDSF